MSNIFTWIALPFLTLVPKHHPATPAPDSSFMTLVQVQNDDPAPLTVYAQDAVGEFKLGIVEPGATSILRIPDLMIQGTADVEFFVHPRGGTDQGSGFVEIRDGDRIGLLVPKR